VHSMRMESPLNQRLRRSPPDVVYTPIDVTSWLDNSVVCPSHLSIRSEAQQTFPSQGGLA
jgi:hypothetical protein